MTITKKEGRQEEICAILPFSYADFTAIVGADADVTEEAINLPQGAMITDGFIVIDEAFNTEGAKATQTLTTSAAPTALDTVTIGTTVYTFVAALSAGPTVPYEVLIVGIDEEITNDNLKAAINHEAGIGVSYSTGTAIHPTVTATAATLHTVVLQAKTGGTAGNSIATTETHTAGAFADTSLDGGAAGADTLVVKIGSTAYASISATATGLTALTPTATVLTVNDTIDLTHGVANTSITAASAGSGKLVVRYVVDGRAAFTQD